MLEGLRGEESIAVISRREGIHTSQYYKWSKEFLEAGKKRLNGGACRAIAARLRYQWAESPHSFRRRCRAPAKEREPPGGRLHATRLLHSGHGCSKGGLHGEFETERIGHHPGYIPTVCRGAAEEGTGRGIPREYRPLPHWLAPGCHPRLLDDDEIV